MVFFLKKKGARSVQNGLNPLTCFRPMPGSLRLLSRPKAKVFSFSLIFFFFLFLACQPFLLSAPRFFLFFPFMNMYVRYAHVVHKLCASAHMCITHIHIHKGEKKKKKSTQIVRRHILYKNNAHTYSM